MRSRPAASIRSFASTGWRTWSSASGCASTVVAPSWSMVCRWCGMSTACGTQPSRTSATGSRAATRTGSSTAGASARTSWSTNRIPAVADDYFDRIGDLQARRKKSLAMGGDEKVAKQHEKGKLTVRERIDLLFDRGTFVELGLLAKDRGWPVNPHVEGVVTGVAY